MAIEYLKYLQVGNFNELPSDMEDIIDFLEERTERYPLYPFAARDWLFYARDHWEQPELMTLAKSLFSPSKTKAFTSWAAGLISGLRDRLLNKQSIGMVMTHSDFTTLHLAAMLSLPDICSYLLEQHVDINLESPVGIPLQCAVQGISSFYELGPYNISNYRYNWDTFPFVDRGHYIVAIKGTVDCLYEATFNCRCCSPFSGLSLLTIAFETVVSSDLLMPLPMALISAGAELQDRDVDHAENMLKGSGIFKGCWGKHDDAIESFLKALFPLVDKSPAHLRLCSLVWQHSAEHNVEFTFDTTNIDTRIVYPAGIDVEHVIETVKTGNEMALRMILKDPRFEPSAAIEEETGNSLLHCAMDADYCIKTEIVRLLVDAGCNTKSINLAGELPIHLWMINDPDDEDEVIASLELVADLNVDCSYQDLKGNNVLHLAGSSLKLKAILENQSTDCITQAMQAINAEGYAPFAYLLKKHCLESAEILTEYIQSFAMVASPAPVLLLAVEHNAEQIFEFLINSDLGVSSRDDFCRNPLHFLGPFATEDFVIRLKLLYPDTCNLHSVDGPPLRSYMLRCLQEYHRYWDPETHINTAVITQLYVEDKPPFLMWESFTSAMLSFTLKGYAPKIETAEFGMCLISLGYLASYESHTKQSGLIPLIGTILSEDLKVEESYSALLLDQVTRKTNYWSTFLESHLAVRLLEASIKTRDTRLTRLMLEKGMSVHQRVNGWSTLERLVSQGESTEGAKAIFHIIVSHADKSRMDEIGIDGLGLLHLCKAGGSEWMIELLVQRGADPNLSSTIGSRDPPVVHHLMSGRFKHASVLLSSGADPGNTCASGFNAILAASWSGATRVLEDMYCVSQSQERAAWQKTATFISTSGMGRIKCAGANGLHIASVRGHVPVLKFYETHGLFESRFESNCDSGLRPIHYATLGGSLRAVEFLCAQGCEVMAKGKDGRTSLHLAAMNGNHEVAKALIQAGCTPSLDVYNRSPLFYAHQSGEKPLIEYLRSLDSIPGCTLQQANTIGVASLLIRRAAAASLEDAITQNNLVLCERLYASGFSMDTPVPSCGCCSPLIKAIMEKRLELIQWFLDKEVSMAKTAGCLRGCPSTLHLLLSKLVSVEILSKGLQNYMKQGGTFLGESPPFVYTAITNKNIVGLRALLRHLGQNMEHYT